MLEFSRIFHRIFLSCGRIQQRHYKKLLDIHSKVQNAFKNDLPIVALESTIITHGMPYPYNVNTAIEVEQLISKQNVVPATIAVIGGRLKIGLSHQELEMLANAKRNHIMKCSRRDLPYAMAMGRHCGTTVSATMLIAHMAGIKIFATGGIGGVHRNGHDTMDISADLTELGKTPVVVVSSGIKSILDIPRTLEYLETQGVCVATYLGDIDEDGHDNQLHNVVNGNFPDFYTRDSGYKAPYLLHGSKEAARLIKALNDLHIQSGMLIAVPIPQKYALDKILLNQAVETALKEAATNGIKGKDVTPYLLEAIANITEGSSLQANIALIRNNANVAAQIANELWQINKVDRPINRLDSTKLTNRKGKPLVVGASMLDLSSTLQNDVQLALNGATYCTQVKYSAGGVGHNLAEGIYKLLRDSVNFISIVGDDYSGHQLLQLMPEALRKHIYVTHDEATATCSIILDKEGDCKMCLANAQINDYLTPKLIKQYEQEFREACLIILDANLNIATMEAILKLAVKYRKIIFYEPTDFLKATKPFHLDAKLTQQIRFISPNLNELKALAEHFTKKSNISSKTFSNIEPDLTHLTKEEILKRTYEFLKAIESHFDCILVTLGKYGALISLNSQQFSSPLFDQQTGQFNFEMSSQETAQQRSHIKRYYEAPFVDEIVNVSGAGDSLTSGFIAGMLRGLTVNQCIALGFHAATKALKCTEAVPSTYFDSTAEEKHFLRNLRL